jgi:hypothetical protein
MLHLQDIDISHSSFDMRFEPEQSMLRRDHEQQHVRSRSANLKPLSYISAIDEEDIGEAKALSGKLSPPLYIPLRLMRSILCDAEKGGVLRSPDYWGPILYVFADEYACNQFVQQGTCESVE